ASDFIHDIELKVALARHARGEVRVVPVLLRATDLKGHALERLQSLPRHFKPVVQWQDRDEAWLDVVNELREVIERLPRLTVVAAERQSLSEQYAAALRELNALKQENAPETVLLEARKQAISLRDRLLQGDLQSADILDGRFRLSQCLGQGGFASVWLAQHLMTGERVVLKILHAILTSDEERLRRFRRGSEQMSRLSHPNILKVLEPYRVSSDGDTERPHARRHFVVLEWASRGDLAVWSRKQKYVPPLQEVLQTGIDAASALAFAHAQGCIHRDVKPHNLLRMADGTLKLTDFDLAKLVNSTLLTRTGTAGTAFYIAPELQEALDGDESTPISESVDVYSLGWTLVALLKRKDITATDLIKRQDLLDKLQVPERVQQVLLKAVEVYPTNRYQSMTAFREALVRVREQVSVTPAPAKPVVAASDPVSEPRSVNGLTPMQALEAELAKLPLKDRLERLREWGQKGDSRLGLEKPENWIWLPPGEFMMGSNDNDREKPIHQVKLTQGFNLSRFPVTNHDFKAFIKDNGYRTQTWWSEEGWAFCQKEKLEAP
ncbi:MAG: bifunctional serine/threonine-protein kinase/formylglycine-generating enzyme family protein, partial [Myxococcota bacterium]